MPSPPSLAIFDCDGVLVDSEQISNEVLAGKLSAVGLPMSAEECRRTFDGGMLPDVIARAEMLLGRPLPAGFLARYEHDRADALRERLKPVPGAEATVRTLKAAGVGVCVASQGRLSKTELTLQLTGLRPLFPDHALFSAYEVPRGKPFPDLFLMAAAKMGAAVPDCVVIEDSPTGVRAGVAAGMRVFGFAQGADLRILEELGAEPLTSLEELPARLAH